MIDAYLDVVADSPFDKAILSLGFLLLLAQFFGLYMRCRGKSVFFVQRLYRYQNVCLQLTELLPLLGIMGTVIGLLNTFASFGVTNGGQPDVPKLVATFAPAMSTTLSGLFAALLNLLVNIFMWLAFPETPGETDRET